MRGLFVLTKLPLPLLSLALGGTQSVHHFLDLVAIRSLGRQPQVGLVVIEGTLVIQLIYQGVGEVKVCPGIIGGCVKRLPILLDFAGGVTLFPEKETEIEMSFRIVFFNLDRSSVFEYGAVDIAAISQEDTKVVMGLGITWIESYRFPVMPLGSGQVTLDFELDTSFDLGFGFGVPGLGRSNKGQSQYRRYYEK